MSKLNPKNKEEAYAHQFEDDVKFLLSASLLSKEDYKGALERLKTHIASYEEETAKSKTTE